MAIIFPDNHNEKQQFNLGENLNLVFSFNKYKISRGLHYISVVIVNSGEVVDIEIGSGKETELLLKEKVGSGKHEYLILKADTHGTIDDIPSIEAIDAYKNFYGKEEPIPVKINNITIQFRIDFDELLQKKCQ